MSEILSKEMQQQLVDRMVCTAHSVMLDLAQAIASDVSDAIPICGFGESLEEGVYRSFSEAVPKASDILEAIEKGASK